MIRDKGGDGGGGGPGDMRQEDEDEDEIGDVYIITGQLKNAAKTPSPDWYKKVSRQRTKDQRTISSSPHFLC